MTGTETRSLLDAARELAPKIRAAADEIEAERELPRALFEVLADAGFYHMAVPRSLGGAELDLPTYIQVLEELGKADASAAWTINQGAIYATYAARMPKDIARAIWIDTPRAVVAEHPRPDGERPSSCPAGIGSPAARASAPAAGMRPGSRRTPR